MSNNKLNSKSVIKVFFLIFTSVCTILSFLYIVLGDKELTKFVADFFVVSFVVFLVIVVLLLGIFLFRLEPGIKDGRYLLLIIPTALSLASIYLYFKGNSPENRWGLIFLIVALSISVLLIILTLFLWVTKSFTSSEAKEFIVTSVSTQLVRLGNHKYEHDVYKTIQSRVPVLTKIDVRFKWTGDKVDPEIVKASSVTHQAGKVKVDDEGYDSVRLVFNEPIYFKQSATCHFKLSNLSDSESPAESYLSQMVKSSETIYLISFYVVLKDVKPDYCKDALLQRKKESAPTGAKYQDLGKVAFDTASRSYHYDLYNPEPGYDYRVFWGNK